jgi:hypothetical protein
MPTKPRLQVEKNIYIAELGRSEDLEDEPG